MFTQPRKPKASSDIHTGQGFRLHPLYAHTHTHTLCTSMLKSFIQSVHWTLTHAGSALAAAVQVLSQLRETGSVCVCVCSWDNRFGSKFNWVDGNTPWPEVHQSADRGSAFLSLCPFWCLCAVWVADM